MKRFEVLDGWRGIAIVFVMLGHLFPLGPSEWSMNQTAGRSGMSLFFILSGFLITSHLIRDRDIGRFLIRRFVRIIPLAWLILPITLYLSRADGREWFSNIFFYANLPPESLNSSAVHFWSLNVEVQFYIAIALLVLIFRERFLWILPPLCICVTLYRIYHGQSHSINTYFRVDEILAGCTLATINYRGSSGLKNFMRGLYPPALFILLLCSANPHFTALNYLKPYVALLLVSSTLFSHPEKWYNSWLRSKALCFIASISYALYVIHGVLVHTWLGEGDRLEMYAKRPLLLLITFALAYISTEYYEKYWIRLGKRWTQKPAASIQA